MPRRSKDGEGESETTGSGTATTRPSVRDVGLEDAQTEVIEQARQTDADLIALAFKGQRRQVQATIAACLAAVLALAVVAVILLDVRAAGKRRDVNVGRSTALVREFLSTIETGNKETNERLDRAIALLDELLARPIPSSRSSASAPAQRPIVINCHADTLSGDAQLVCPSAPMPAPAPAPGPAPVVPRGGMTVPNITPGPTPAPTAPPRDEIDPREFVCAFFPDLCDGP